MGSDETYRAADSLPPTEGPGAAGSPNVPLAAPIEEEWPSAFLPFMTPWGPMGPWPGPLPFPRPWPPEPQLRDPCDLKQGCYHISFGPRPQFPPGPYHVEPMPVYLGTMRVDRAGGRLTISGDLYRFPPFKTLEAVGGTPVAQVRIPIYGRDLYYSYLKVMHVQRTWPQSFDPFRCGLTLTAEEYVYTQPVATSFAGAFPAPPGTRTVTIALEPSPAPPGYPGDYFAGTLSSGGAPQGTFTMGWVSDFFRRATVEVDTAAGAAPPVAVPAISGPGTEDIRTAFASAGWDVTVVYDQVDPSAIPAGFNPNVARPCSGPGFSLSAYQSQLLAPLHQLMTNARNPATNLDAEWRMHLIVIPAGMGSCRGVAYDSFGAPREGVASFSDDGYPASESSNFGSATGKKQREVPRAFLRSACHEVGHGFGLTHTDNEGLPVDNSIMTATGDVADLLGGPTTGASGVFPDDIALRFSARARHHLAHRPDIVVRPGGDGVPVLPEADRRYLPPKQLEIKLQPEATRIDLGEPLRIGWTLVNNSDASIRTPSVIRLEAGRAFITVTQPNGHVKPMPPFAQVDTGHLEELPPQHSRDAETRLYWSSTGFAFETPGRHVVEVQVAWTDADVPLGVRSSVDVWVKYPQSAADEEAADVLLDPDVGMYVALGGGVSHLTRALSRLERVMAIGGESEQPSANALRGYDGLLPDD